MVSMNVINALTKSPNKKLQQLATIQSLQLLKQFKYNQVPSQVIEALEARGLGKKDEESMDEWTDRVIAAYKEAVKSEKS